MPYIALKPVKFDREYLVGEIIPDQAVDAGRASALEGMKLIARTAAQAPAEDAVKGSEDNTPDQAENAAEAAPAPAEDEKKPKGKK